MTLNHPGLQNTRVLVLEDDYYLAMDMEDDLTAAGATVIGPFSDPDFAVQAIVSERPDCALVDLNLGGGISLELPRALARCSVPFAFVTGYDQTDIPQEFARVERAEKPIATNKAVELVIRLLKS